MFFLFEKLLFALQSADLSLCDVMRHRMSPSAYISVEHLIPPFNASNFPSQFLNTQFLSISVCLFFSFSLTSFIFILSLAVPTRASYSLWLLGNQTCMCLYLFVFLITHVSQISNTRTRAKLFYFYYYWIGSACLAFDMKINICLVATNESDRGRGKKSC